MALAPSRDSVKGHALRSLYFQSPLRPLKKTIIHYTFLKYQATRGRAINYTLSALWRCEVLVKFLLGFETQWVWRNILIFRMLCSFLLGFACFSRKTLYRPPLKNFFFRKKDAKPNMESVNRLIYK